MNGQKTHKYYLLVSLWIPAVIMLANANTWLVDISLIGWVATDPGGQGIVVGTIHRLRDWGPWVFVAVQLSFAGSLLGRLARGRGINLPELLVIVASVSLHWVTVMAVIDLPPELLRSDPLAQYALVPLVTIYHNIQYHALIWHYNKAKYRCDGAAAKFRAAAKLNQSVPVHLACGLAYTAVTIGVEHYGVGFLRGQTVWLRVLAGAIWGWSFMHYWLDGKIWHVREDADLRRVLGFPEPPASRHPG